MAERIDIPDRPGAWSEVYRAEGHDDEVRFFEEDPGARSGHRLVGAWYRRRDGEVLDDLVGGSEAWTQTHAVRILSAR